MAFGGRRSVVTAIALCAAAALAGCTSAPPVSHDAPQPSWTVQPSSSASAAAGSSTAFVPGGTAAENQRAFDAAVQSVLTANANADGSAVVAALSQAGFDKGAMQVSASRTSANLQPGSISVSVKLGDECLVGQWGTAVDGYHSAVTPVLGSGGCLIGGTAPVG